MLTFIRKGAGLAARIIRSATPATLKSQPLDPATAKPDFTGDGRGGRLVFAAHCMLNQNARDAGTADFPASMKPILAVLAEKEIGIVQLPCPELMVLGIGRQRETSPLGTVYERLQLPAAHVRLQYLVEQVVYQIKEYHAQGFRILGILGKNGSPTCGVQAGTGVFIRLLKQRLQAEGLEVPIHGIDDHCQQRAIDWILDRC